MKTTYKIIRKFRHKEDELVDVGLTLQEAQEHCSSPDTHGEGWFDSYYPED